MADFQSDLFTALSGYAGLSTLVGNRIYPNGAPQDPATPFIVYYEFATPREQTMSCDIAVSKPRIQYSIYGTSYHQVLDVAAALRSALDASTYMVIYEDERGNKDMTSGLNRRDIDVRITHAGV